MASASSTRRSQIMQSSLGDFFEHSPIVAYEVALDMAQDKAESKFNFVSPNSAVVFGYDAQALLGNSNLWQQNIHPDDQNQYLATRHLATSNEPAVAQNISLQYRLRHQQGHEVWVRDDFRVVERQGQLILIGTCTDMSETEQLRQSLEARTQELATSQQLTQQILDAIAYTIFIKDEQHQYAFANQALSEFLGFEAQQIIGNTDYAFFTETQADIFRQQDLKVRQQDHVEHLDEVVIDPNGEEHFLWTTKSCFTADQQYLLGIVLDMTAYKKVETDLADSVQRFENVVNNVPGMIFQLCLTATGELQLLGASDYCQHIFEVDPNGAIANVQQILTQIHPEDQAEFEATLYESAHNLTKWRHEWRILTPSGQPKWLRSRSEPIRLKNGDTIWNGIIFDNSDRQKIAEERLYRRNLKSTAINIFQGLLRNPHTHFVDILRQVGQVTESDRAFLICHSQPQRGSRLATEWCRQGNGSSIRPYFENLEFDHDSWWMQEISQNREIICNHYDDLPPAAAAIKTRLEQAGINCLAAVPIFDNQQQLWGVLALALHQPDIEGFNYEDAQILRIVGEMLYVTAARQNQQQQLRESEAKFRGIFDHAGVGIVQLDQDFRFTEVNSAFAEMLGEEANDFLGQSFLAITATDSSQGDRQFYNHLATTGFVTGEQCLYNSFGREIWVKIHFSQVQAQANESDLHYYIAVIEDISQRKRAEEISRALLVRNQSLLIALGEITYDHFLREDILNWEGNYRATLGHSAEEIGNDTASWMALIHPDDREAVLTEFHRAMTEENKLFDIEYRFRCQDGSYLWMHDRGVMQGNYQGRSERFIGVMRDISARKESEEQLRASEERYRQIVETAQEGIWVLDAEAKTDYVNPQMAAMLGYSPEEMLRQSLYAFMDEENQVLAKVNFTQRQQGIAGNHDFCFRHRDGSEVWTMISTSPLTNDSGEFIGALGMVSDISDRHRAEQELIQNRDLREAIFNESADALFLVDTETLLTFDCNEKAVEMFERQNKEELIGIEGHILQRQQFTEVELLAIAEDIQTTGSWNRELEFVTKTGRIFWGHLAAKNITVAGRKMNLVRVTDIDQRKKAEQQLLQTNAELERATRLKDEFLANMSHELRTPLNAILGLGEVLQDEVYGKLNAPQRRSLQTIERNGQHLLALINDVLHLSKIEAGHLSIEPNAVSVKAVCSASLNLIREQINEKQQRLQIQYPTISPVIRGDELRLRQVLINLLSNAIKFTDVGGEIQLAITLQPEQEQLSIHIKDNGIGIAPENIGKLFQPFVQLDSSLTRRFSGTGLGLALVRRIAELHEGSVSVISKLGEGSKFSIHLPWSPSSQLPSQTIQNQTLIKLGEESVHNQHNSLQQEQPVILIADDDDDNIETMWDYLLSQGYRLIRAKHGQEALEFVAQSPPDLILMDIQMPEMDGFTAIARLRETFTKEDLPIIALTALAMDGDRQRCLDAGANIYLSKPFRLKTLVQEIRQLLTPPN